MKQKKSDKYMIYRILNILSGLYWIRTSDPYPVKVML
jgi:hypothetical protein